MVEDEFYNIVRTKQEKEDVVANIGCNILNEELGCLLRETCIVSFYFRC